MELSTSFGIDPREPWVVAHNEDVRAVLEAFHAGRPIRVPLLCGEWTGQHGFYADETGLDYRQYYTDPDTMLRVQLEAARRRRELPIYDVVLAETPAEWPVSVDLWPVVAPGWIGCDLLYRSDAVIAHRSMGLSKQKCDERAMPDPQRGGILGVMRRLWEHLRAHYEGKLVFLGRRVGPIAHGVGTNGVFSLALDMRGEAIMSDMYEDPDFVHRFLAKLRRWVSALEAAWNGSLGPFSPSDHGIDMLSPHLYEEFLVPLIVQVNRERGTVPPSQLHHCGRGAQLFPVVKRHFGLTLLNALTYPLVDVAKVRRDLGEDVEIQCVVADNIIRQGPPEQIRRVVCELMASGVKGKGGFSLIAGDMLPGTPLEHRVAYYEAVKEYGRYD